MTFMPSDLRVLFLPKNSRHEFFSAVLHAAVESLRWRVQVVCEPGAQKQWSKAIGASEFYSVPDFTKKQDWEGDDAAERELDDFISACERRSNMPVGHIVLAGERDLGRGFSEPAYHWFRNRISNLVLADNGQPYLIVRRMFAFARDALKAASPDVVIGGEWADTLCFVTSLAARQMGIRCVVFRPSKLWSGRGYWTDDPLMYNSLAREASVLRRQRGAEISDRARTKVLKFRQSPTTLGYVQKNWDNDAARGWLGYHVTLAKLMAVQLSHAIGWRKGPPPKPAFQIAWDHYRRPFLKHLQRGFFQRFDQKDLASRRYIFLALHKDPEQALNYQAPFWSNQINTVAFLSALLPMGYSLLVREHRLNTGRRPTDYYRQLTHLPGVVLIDAFDSQFKYIANADLVVTDNGSTGWEALMLGRRVMSVAPHFFEGAGLDCRVFDLEQIPATVLELLNKPGVQDENYDRKLGWLLDAEWETTTPMQPIDPPEMFGQLQKVLSDTPADQAMVRNRFSA